MKWYFSRYRCFKIEVPVLVLRFLSKDDANVLSFLRDVLERIILKKTERLVKKLKFISMDVGQMHPSVCVNSTIPDRVPPNYPFRQAQRVVSKSSNFIHTPGEGLMNLPQSALHLPKT